MPHILSVDTVFFTVIGYPMSYIEFFGTAFNLWCVWLAAKNKVLNWPVGIVAVVLFFILFWEIRLYSDMFEQAYFFITGFWGWYVWSRRKKTRNSDDNGELEVSAASGRERMLSVIAIAVGTAAAGAFMSRIDLIYPAYFPEPASFPYLDAFTTIMSFVATVLMVRRKADCWYLWILVDIIGIWLYFVKGVKFISLEYAVFLTMATAGLFKWRRILNDRKAYAALQDGSGSGEVLPAPSRP